MPSTVRLRGDAYLILALGLSALVGCPEPTPATDGDGSDTGDSGSGSGNPGDGDPGDGDGDGDGDPGDGDGDPGDGDGDGEPGDGDGDGDPGDGDGDCVPGNDGCACDEGICNDGLNCVADQCVQPSCGDAIVDPGELCDDGNADNTDACTEVCELAACGDGYVQAGEDCDDGNLVNGDDCNAYCLDSGGLIWEQIWDQNNEFGEWPHDVATDADGNIVVVGKRFFGGSGGDHWALIAKFDSDGQPVWDEVWFNANMGFSDWLQAVAIDSLGDIYAGGEEQLGEPDWLTVKYTADGDFVWQDIYDVWTVEEAHAAIVDVNDELVMVGYDSSVNGFHGHLRKYTTDGGLEFTRTINAGGSITITEGIVEMSNGDYVTLTRGGAAVLRRFTPNGAVVWTANIAKPGVYWEHLSVDGQDRLVAVAQGDDITVTQFDENGTELWTQTHDQLGNTDVGWGVEASDDGSIYVVGHISNEMFQYRAWVRKYDVDGNVMWTDLDLGPDGPRDFTGVTIDPDGAVIVCGMIQTGVGATGFNLVLRKYAP